MPYSGPLHLVIRNLDLSIMKILRMGNHQETIGERTEYIQVKVGGSGSLLKLTGTSTSQQSKLIRGEIKNPRIDTLIAIAKAGCVSLDWLVFGSEESHPQDSHELIYLPFAGNTESPMGFKPEELERYCKEYDKTKQNIVLYHHASDNMAPEIERGSIAFVDQNQKDVEDGTFLLSVNGHHMILRYSNESQMNNKATSSSRAFTSDNTDSERLDKRPIMIFRESQIRDSYVWPIHNVGKVIGHFPNMSK